jgi:type 1 glutamine amidotransferase
MSRKLLLASLALQVALAATAFAAPKMKALIVDGQNNHDWKSTTPVLKKDLEDSGLFRVDVATTPPKGGPMEQFKPNFAAYRVVVLNYVGDNWSEPVRAAFLDYVRKGGGVVVFHAADNAFGDWPEFTEIVGLGGWVAWNEKSGPYLYWKDGKIVRDDSPGRAGNHGRQHAYQITVRDPKHPVMAGLPPVWMHAKDELYDHMRGPAKNLTLLATAYSDPATRGSGRDEPLMFTIAYGKGRIFHTMIGHDPSSMSCVGFIVTLQRGAEWAATGKVKRKVPADFPTATEVRTRP